MLLPLYGCDTGLAGPNSMESSSSSSSLPGGSSGTLHGRAIVLVAFHGVGKTTFAQRYEDSAWADREVIDLDPFHASVSRDGTHTVSSWDSYFAELEALLAQPVLLLLPCLRVLDWLVAHGVPFVLFLPERDCMQQWVDTRLAQDAVPAMAALLRREWDQRLSEYESRVSGGRCLLVELSPTTFLRTALVARVLGRFFLPGESASSWTW